MVQDLTRFDLIFKFTTGKGNSVRRLLFNHKNCRVHPVNSLVYLNARKVMEQLTNLYMKVRSL